MEHSSLNVSLTYLRGLEVAELQEEDMPMVEKGNNKQRRGPNLPLQKILPSNHRSRIFWVYWC